MKFPQDLGKFVTFSALKTVEYATKQFRTNFASHLPEKVVFGVLTDVFRLLNKKNSEIILTAIWSSTDSTTI